MSEREPLVIEFESIEREQIRACRYVLNRRRVTWVCYVILAGTALLGLVPMTMTAIRTGGIAWLTVAVGSAPLILVAVFTYFLPVRMVRQARKQLAMYRGNQRWTFSPKAGVEVTLPGAKASYEWSSFRNAMENREFFFLAMSSTMVCSLPKRAVGTADHELRSLLKDQLGDRAKLAA